MRNGREPRSLSSRWTAREARALASALLRRAIDTLAARPPLPPQPLPPPEVAPPAYFGAPPGSAPSAERAAMERRHEVSREWCGAMAYNAIVIYI